MAVTGLKAVYQWVMRTMMKAKGETGIVQTMPKKDLVELNTQITAQRLMQNGIDPTQLKNADQVENAIIAIENRPKVQQGIKSTKSADIFELQMPPKKIDPKKLAHLRKSELVRDKKKQLYQCALKNCKTYSRRGFYR